MEDFLSMQSNEDIPSSGNPEVDAKNQEISELSKKGYQYLKDNDIRLAKESFKRILEIDENNNYALVGLGDCERKQNKFKEAVSTILSASSPIREIIMRFLDSPIVIKLSINTIKR